MLESEELISTDIKQYLKIHENKSLLRFITCGSVDDGKSTLIGRLLYDSKLLYDDHLSSVEKESKQFGTQGDNIDFALLVDGLAAEREQGITIDVAYRFFSTEKRKFIVADTPGHEQYTRNMVTGASTADAAILMVDARKGILEQTRRHSFLMSLIGIQHIIVAINKMDLMNYSEETFKQISQDYETFSKDLGFGNILYLPISALVGDNIITKSENTPWYKGQTLLKHLETLEMDGDHMLESPFRMPVQWVNRPNLDFRGFSGTIAGGKIEVGDTIRALPSGQTSTVKSIFTYDGDLDVALPGQSVTLTLDDEIDISRGDIIAGKDNPPEIADQFEAKIVWMSDEPLLPGRRYLMKIGTRVLTVSVTEIKYQYDINSMEKRPAKQLELNTIAVCNIYTERTIAFDAYQQNHDTGGFILIDRMTNNTVGAGMIDFALRRSSNIHYQHVDIDKAARSKSLGQKPCALWFTGLSGSGKSTIANLVDKKLFSMGYHSYLLDGDNVRHGLNKDLGFTDVDRVENIRRIANVAQLMTDAGLIVLTAFISPFASERRLARDTVGENEFIEIFIDTPLKVAEDRDPKGLYKKARRGELKNFTGIDSDYEAPENPQVIIDTTTVSAVEAAEQIVTYLQDNGYI